MDNNEIENFCELYLPHLLNNGLPNTSDLATHWSRYEANLKALKLPLQEFDSTLLQQFQQLDTVSETFIFQNKRYAISLSQIKQNTHQSLTFNNFTPIFSKIA